MKPQTIAVAILAQDEEKQIPRLTEMLKGADVDKIYFFDDFSDDSGVDLIYELLPSKWVTAGMEDYYERFGDKKNFIHTELNEFDWVLHIDADEKFDPFFLKNIQTVMQKAPRTISFAFKRINLPGGTNYPDYQVRLMKITPDIGWRGKYHEKPYSKEENKPLIDLALDYKGNVTGEGKYRCVILEEFPIIHLLRRTDITREWW